MPKLSNEQGKLLLDNLKGQVMSDDWEEVDNREYSEENLSNEIWASASIVEKKSLRNPAIIVFGEVVRHRGVLNNIALQHNEKQLVCS